MDLREAALVASVAAVLATFMPTWDAIRTIAAVGSMHGQSSIPYDDCLFIFTAILPVFYFGLYGNKRTLRFSRHLHFRGSICRVAK